MFCRWLHRLEENKGYKQLLGVKGISIAFTTSAGVKRLKQIRERTASELRKTGEMQYKHLFYFTLVQKPIDQYQIRVHTTWLPLYENVAGALLGI